MRIPTITLLFLATTAAAVSAAPTREETTGRVSYTDSHHKPRTKPHGEPSPTGGWIELASATPASHGREFIEVGAAAGAFTQLRLTAVSGRPGIRAVRVDYQDGSHKTFEVEQVLGGTRRPAYVDLHGSRELLQVVVITDLSSPGSYMLEASAAVTGVAMR